MDAGATKTLLFLALCFSFWCCNARAGFLYADQSGASPGGQTASTTIQAAVNGTPANGTIIVVP